MTGQRSWVRVYVLRGGEQQDEGQEGLAAALFSDHITGLHALSAPAMSVRCTTMFSG